MTGRRFVWFAPNAGNWVTYRMEHRVANALADAGDDVLMVQCDSVLDAFCQVMSPAGLTPDSTLAERHAVCRECRYAAGLARDQARYRTAQLSEFLEPEDRAWVDDLMSMTTVDNWADLEVAGLPVGRYASYTAMLHHKRASVTETAEAWREYRADLRGALLVARAMPRIAEANATHAVVYNALYPANRVFAEALRARGAVLMNLSAGPTVPRRYKTLAVYDGVKASQTMTDSQAFRASMKVPATAMEVWNVEDHIEQLMSGSDPWVYSSAASSRSAAQVRGLLAIRPDAKVVTVIVSSPDETRSTLMVDAEFVRDPVTGYSEVAEFLASSIELARSRPDADFVFRLHPRLAPNKRESLASPDLDTIYDLLSDLPGNAVVNHPTDGLSLYDLVLISHAAVNHTSSAGLEFLVFGIPVVQFDPVRSGIYPADFSIVVPRDAPERFAGALDQALREGFDLERSVRAFRWYAAMQIRSVIHLDPLDDRDPATTPSAPTTAPEPPRPHPLGRVLPGRLKEYLAMRLQRRRRAGELAGLPPLGAEASADLLSAVARTTGRAEVWEPFMALPAHSDGQSEREAVTDALRRLVTRLATDDVEGLGAIAGFTTRAR